MSLRSLIFVLAIVSLQVILQGTATNVTKSYAFSFKIKNYACSIAIRENQIDDTAYVALVNKIVSAVAQAYTGDVSYKSAKVVRIDCGSVTPVVEVTKSASSLGTQDMELDLVRRAINTGTFAGYTVELYSPTPAAAPTPGLYITLETGLSTKQLCANRQNFRKALSLMIVNANGESLIHTDQVVFAEHKCYDTSAAFKKASPKIYIAPSTSALNTVDTEVTTRLSALIEQFVSDGTTWRLSAAFSGQVASAKLGGANKPDDSKLSELDRVGIGMGVTFFILIIIIVVILIVARVTKNKSDALTFGNESYEEQVAPKSADNSGYEKETKVNIGDNSNQYDEVEAGKEPYTDLQTTHKQPPQEAYTPLGEGAIEVKVKVGPEGGD